MEIETNALALWPILLLVAAVALVLLKSTTIWTLCTAHKASCFKTKSILPLIFVELLLLVVVANEH